MHQAIYIIFGLFFASLAGIVGMLGYKLSLVRNGEVGHGQHFHFFIFDFIRAKQAVKKLFKQTGFIFLVFVLRFNVKASNFLKEQFKSIIIKLSNLLSGPQNSVSDGSAQEVSGFLKMMSDYKKKVKYIKRRIKQEEEGK